MKKTIVLLLCLLPIMLSNSQAQPETDAPASQYNIKYVLKKDGKIVETKAWDMSTGELKYPKEIPFIEYSLESTSCEWIDLRHYKDTVIVINSDEELENYLVCTDGSYQEIDFSKYTLLLTNGIATGNLIKIDIGILMEITDRYVMKIIAHIGFSHVVDNWTIACLIPKISNTATVLLNFKEIKN